MDLTNRDYEGYKNSFLAVLKEKIPEYTDFSDNDAGMVLVQAIAYHLDKLSYYNDKVEQNLHLDTAQTYTAKVSLANMFNYKVRGAIPYIHKQICEIVPNDFDNTVIFKKGDLITTQEVNESDRIIFEVMNDLVIPPNATGLEKDLEGNYLYTTEVAHGYSKNNVVIGTSNGTSYQQFKINDMFVIEDSIILEVFNGLEFEEWKYVTNFVLSHATDKHYTISFDGIYYYIKFGSGVLGSIPPVYEDGIRVSYRVGGGEAGNVGADKIVLPQVTPARFIRTFNLGEPIQVGVNIENLDDVDEKVPAFNRTMERAVTRKDYEDIAILKLPYVSKVRALKEPVDPETKDGFNVINISVLVNNMEQMTPEYKQKVEDFYDTVKMVNTTVTILDAKYLNINLDIIVWLPNNVKREEVIPNIESYVETYFKLGNKDFGQEFLESDMIVDIKSIPNVKAVSVSRTNDETVQPKEDEIIRKGTINYDIRGGF